MDKTVAQLKEMCKSKGIHVTSSMRKKDLQEALGVLSSSAKAKKSKNGSKSKLVLKGSEMEKLMTKIMKSLKKIAASEKKAGSKFAVGYNSFSGEKYNRSTVKEFTKQSFVLTSGKASFAMYLHENKLPMHHPTMMNVEDSIYTFLTSTAEVRKRKYKNVKNASFANDVAKEHLELPSHIFSNVIENLVDGIIGNFIFLSLE